MGAQQNVHTAVTPQQRYERALERADFVADAAQAAAVGALDDLYHRLLARARREAGLAARWRRVLGRESAPERGLYLWGGVGRGKTWLMDGFTECLPPALCLRVHFHRFMQRVHADLKVLAGTRNPLERVADGLAAEARVLCFDEFFVSDIADAMILGELLRALFSRGVSLVATSNIPPPRLYENGLQRQRFLPAIALLEQHTAVLNVDGGVDYRLRTLERAELYHHPLDAGADLSLRQSFARLAPEPGRDNVEIDINGRSLHCRALGDDVVWFDFHELCETPRSAADYIELAREFHAVLISGVPAMGAGNDDAARRFITLVDEFYDRQVKLVLAAAVPLQGLYGGGRLEFEFQRTLSRLQEMQSHEYLARPHLP